MAKQQQTGDTGLSTEEKIKEAARQVFTRKGYAATRTRDIAEEAGINLALLNYYFRSKEKLFQEVMAEKVMQLFGVIAPVLNDSASTLEAKLDKIVTSYIDMLQQHPDLPLFVLSEIRNNTGNFVSKMNLDKLLKRSSFLQQLAVKRPDMNPFHFLLNILGMTVFPFVAQPVFQAVAVADEKQFALMMEERKKLIPVWIKAMLKAK